MFQRWLDRTQQKLGYVAASAPVAGNVFPLREVQDDAFSRGLIGKGVAIEPLNGCVVAPVTGRVSHVIDTKHAILIEHSSGLQFLIHIGINTVDLKGEGFHVSVKTDDIVTEGQTLMEFDIHNIRKAGYAAHVIVIAIGERLIDYIECDYREVRAAEPNVLRIALK